MKIAVFGGSFNPLHTGHLFIAEEARAALGYDKVIFVPSSISSHKEDFTGLKAQSRLEMLRDVISDYDDFLVDDCDITRGGISYTINTIRDLSEKYSFTGKPGFIIGDDLLSGFASWKNALELRQMIDLIVVKRNSNDSSNSVTADYFIDNTVLPISSTEIRNRVKKGMNIRFLVPEKVRKKIIENGYYR